MEFASKLDGFSDGEDTALRYAQQRTGVSDFLTGVDQGSGRATATETTVKMQEARTRFNWTMDSSRDGMQDVMGMTVSMLQQFGDDRDIDSKIGEEQADLVREFLALPEEEARERAKISVTASTASLNKEAEKNNLLGLKQLNDQSTLSVEMPLVQLILNPQAPQELKDYALAKITGNRVLMDRIFQTFDAKNTDEIMGSLDSLEQAAAAQGPAGAPPVGPGTPGVTEPVANVNVGLPQPVL